MADEEFFWTTGTNGPFKSSRMPFGVATTDECHICHQPLVLDATDKWSFKFAGSGPEDDRKYAHAMCEEGFPGAINAKSLPDGRVAVLYPLIFGWRLLLGMRGDQAGDEVFEWRSDDMTREQVYEAFTKWDGYGYPDGIYRRQVAGSKWWRRCPDENCEGWECNDGWIQDE